MRRDLYPGLGQPRWIAEIIEGGAILVLDDGSKWRVEDDGGRQTVLAWDHLDVQVSRAKTTSDLYVLATSSAAVHAEYIGIDPQDAV